MVVSFNTRNVGRSLVGTESRDNAASSCQGGTSPPPAFRSKERAIFASELGKARFMLAGIFRLSEVLL